MTWHLDTPTIVFGGAVLLLGPIAAGLSPWLKRWWGGRLKGGG